MNPGDLAKQRLINQQIACGACKSPCEVVSTLGAMQAQDYSGALWAIGLRLAHHTESELLQAIRDRTIVRTWPMRGTLHFVAAADARWMLELLTPRVIAGAARRRQMLELDDTIFATCREIFIKALQGDRQLTRDGMYELLESSGISTAKQRGYHILSRLAQDGLLCFGVHDEKQPTFALLDEWAPHSKQLDRNESLATLTLKYFKSHGPATVQDFVWWSGLKMSDAKVGLDSVSSHLVQERVGNTAYWMSPDIQSSDNSTPTVHLLPGFDEYLLGYTDRSAVLDPKHAQQITPGNNGMFMPMIIVNGRVEGIWKRAVKRKSVAITVTPFSPFNKAVRRGLESAAQRYGEYLGLPVTITSDE